MMMGWVSPCWARPLVQGSPEQKRSLRVTIITPSPRRQGPTILSSRVLKPLSPSPTEVMTTPTATSTKPRYSRMLMSASSEKEFIFHWDFLDDEYTFLRLSHRLQNLCFQSPQHWTVLLYSRGVKIKHMYALAMVLIFKDRQQQAGSRHSQFRIPGVDCLLLLRAARDNFWYHPFLPGS